MRERKLLVEMFCKVKGCDREHYGHGYCNAHWYRWKAHGDPLKTIKVQRNRIYLKSDNLRPCRLPEGLAVAIGAMFKRLP